MFGSSQYELLMLQAENFTEHVIYSNCSKQHATFVVMSNANVKHDLFLFGT